MKFEIERILLTKKQKLERVRTYNEFSDEPMNEDEFIARDIYDEYVTMKCLKCSYEERIELDIILDCFDSDFEDYPALICPHCNTGEMIPKDIWQQKKQK